MKGFADNGWQVDFVGNTFFRNPNMKDLSRLLERTKRTGHQSSRNEVPANIRLINPQVLPPNGFLFRMLNRMFFVPQLLKKLHNHYDMVVLYMPSYTTNLLLENISRSWTIFDYVAYFEGHPQKPKDYQEIEECILSQTDMVTTDSTFLYNYLSVRHDKVYQIHHGVQIDYFLNEEEVEDISSYRTICFFGGIDDRIEWETIRRLQTEGYEITLIGPCKIKVPVAINVLPPMNLADLSREIQKYDVFIIPYRMTEYTDGIVPAKIFECLATGKPVLSAPLPSLHPLKELVYLCHMPDDYVKVMKNLMISESKDLRQQRKQVAKSQSTQQNFQELISLINEERGKYEEETAARH